MSDPDVKGVSFFHVQGCDSCLRSICLCLFDLGLPVTPYALRRSAGFFRKMCLSEEAFLPVPSVTVCLGNSGGDYHSEYNAPGSFLSSSIEHTPLHPRRELRFIRKIGAPILALSLILLLHYLSHFFSISGKCWSSSWSPQSLRASMDQFHRVVFVESLFPIVSQQRILVYADMDVVNL
ncbi:hypothetical protein Tco_0708677 [Tanacetum coccineum]